MNELNLKIPGFSISGKTWGNPKNPPVLALHGWLDNANSFAPLAPYLQDNFYLIAVDSPGHGHSSHLPEGCYYHFFDAIFTVIEIIKTLKLDKVHLLGHSMGACLASLLAGVAPEHLLSLCLIEGLGPLSAPADTACKQLSAYAQFIDKNHDRKARGYEHFESAALARAHKGYVSLDIAKTLCERGLIEKEQRFHWRHDQRLMAPSPLRMSEEQILSCLKNISTSTFLLFANKGFAFDPESMKKRIAAVKDLKIKQVTGGHHIHMEQPRIVGQLLLDFYSTL